MNRHTLMDRTIQNCSETVHVVDRIVQKPYM